MNNLYCKACNQHVAEVFQACPECGDALRSLPSELRVGELFDGRYEILSLIEEGGMGAVFLAHQVGLSRDVALKILKPQFSGDDALRRRFYTEGRVLAQLRHPNTIRVLEQSQTESGLLYIVMELLRGETMRDVLTTSGPLPVDRLLHVGIQVCRSLEEAHGQGLVHRDLKPDHVFLEPHAGESDFVRVFDFGIARKVDEDEASRMTVPGTVFGTLTYMSPEQANAEAVDGRADIYSLGIVFHEALTGDPIFQGQKQLACIMRKMVHEPTPIALRYPEVKVPPLLDDLIVRMMSIAPGARPGSVSEVREVLEAVQRQLVSGGHVVDASAPGQAKGRAPTLSWVQPDSETVSVGVTGAARALAFSFSTEDCVARAREKDALRRFMETFHRTGQGALMVMEGGTGVGKSKLSSWLLAQHEEDDLVHVARAEFSSFNTTVSLQGIKDMVRQLLQVGEGVSMYTSDADVRVTSGLRRWAIEDYHLTDVLIDLVYPSNTRSLGPLESNQDRYWELAFSAVMTLLKEISERSRLVLVFDDAQWADERSIEFFQQLLGAVRTHQINVAILLVVNTEQAEEQRAFTRFLVWALRHLKAITRRVSVKPFTEKEFDDFLAELMPLRASTRGEIYRMCQGNPFFAQELLQFLYQEEALVRFAGKFELTRSLSELGDVPLSLKEMVSHKLERLETRSDMARECMQVLEHLALYGDALPLSFLEQALEIQGRGALMENLDDVLDELVDSRFIRLEVEGKDDLIRAYHSIVSTYLRIDRGRGRRAKRIHQAFAAVLEEQLRRKDALANERIGYHHRLAGAIDDSLAYYYKAGREWMEHFDDERARSCFEEYLAAEADAEAPADRARTVDTTYRLAQVLLRLGMVEQAELRFHEVMEVEEAAQGGVHHGSALLGLAQILLDEASPGSGPAAIQHIRRAARHFRVHGHTRDLGQALEQLGTVFMDRARMTLAGLVFGAADRRYRDADALSALPSLYNARGLLSLRLGRAKEAMDAFEQGLSLLGPLNDPILLARTYNNVALAFMQRAMNDEALDYLKKGRQAIEAFNYPHGDCILELNVGVTHILRGDSDQAIASLDAAFEMAQALFSGHLMARILTNKASAVLERGDASLALHIALDARDRSRDVGNHMGEWACIAIIGDAHLRLGELEQAREHLELAYERGRRDGLANTTLAEVEQLLARVYLALGRAGDARALLEQASRIWERLDNEDKRSETRRLIRDIDTATDEAHPITARDTES
jgi:tetratricopeptide (TPR) repeat protein/tRNA A-37 threonylcarbamoyl transferase component Bud32